MQTVLLIVSVILIFTVAVLTEGLLSIHFSCKQTKNLEANLENMYHLIKDLEKLLAKQKIENQNLKLKRENTKQELELKTYKNKEKSLTNKKEFKKQRKKRGAIK